MVSSYTILHCVKYSLTRVVLLIILRVFTCICMLLPRFSVFLICFIIQCVLFKAIYYDSLTVQNKIEKISWPANFFGMFSWFNINRMLQYGDTTIGRFFLIANMIHNFLKNFNANYKKNSSFQKDVWLIFDSFLNILALWIIFFPCCYTLLATLRQMVNLQVVKGQRFLIDSLVNTPGEIVLSTCHF